MHALAGVASPLVQLLVGGFVVVLVDLVVLRLVAVGIIRDALGILPVPDRVLHPVRRVLRLDVAAA